MYYMKRLFNLLLACVCVVSVSCGNVDTKIFTLSAEIEGLKGEGEMYLFATGGGGRLERAFAFAPVKDGKFVLRDSIDSPRYCNMEIRVGGKILSRSLILGNELITIRGKVSKDENANFIWDECCIEDSRLNQLLPAKLAFWTDYQEKLKKARNKYNEILLSLNNRQLTRDEIDSVTRTQEFVRVAEEMRQMEKECGENVNRVAKQVVLRDKDTFWGPLIMAICGDAFLWEESLEIFDQFSEEAKASYYGRLLRERFYPDSSSRDMLPDFSAKNREGEMYAIEEARKGKKCIIIDFWGTHCAPCIQAIPHLKSLYAEYASKGLEIVSISIDLKEAMWKNSLDKLQMPWINLLDTRAVFNEKFNGMAIPYVLVVDASGKIVARNLKGDDLRDKVKEVLAIE